MKQFGVFFVRNKNSVEIFYLDRSDKIVLDQEKKL